MDMHTLAGMKQDPHLAAWFKLTPQFLAAGTKAGRARNAMIRVSFFFPTNPWPVEPRSAVGFPIGTGWPTADVEELAGLVGMCKVQVGMVGQSGSLPEHSFTFKVSSFVHRHHESHVTIDESYTT